MHDMLTELSVLVVILVITVLSLAAAGRDRLERRRAAPPPR